MSFDEEGFLSDDIESLAEPIRRKHKDLFQLFCEISRFAEKTKNEFLPQSEDRQKLISTCLFIKCLEGIQASIVLAKIGLDADAVIVLRGVFETLVHLVLCVEEESYSFKYLNKHEVHRLDLIKKAYQKKDRDGVWADIRNHFAKDDIVKLEQELRDKGIETDIEVYRRKYSISNLAQKAKLSDLYDSFYTVTSDYTHANPLSLERYVSTDSSGKIFQLNHGPCDNYAKTNLISAAEFSLVAMSAMCKLFVVDKEKEIKDFHDRLKKLS